MGCASITPTGLGTGSTLPQQLSKPLPALTVVSGPRTLSLCCPGGEPAAQLPPALLTWDVFRVHHTMETDEIFTSAQCSECCRRRGAGQGGMCCHQALFPARACHSPHVHFPHTLGCLQEVLND